MANNTIVSCFLILLVILPIFGRNIVNDYDHVVEMNVKQILPTGMDIHHYNNLVINYWTPERMKSAKSIDLLSIDKIDDLEIVNHSPTTTNNKSTPRQINIPGVSPKSLTASPSVIGKLFVRLGTSDYSCSASVIVSTNGDTLFTAGQCVWNSASQTWASDVIFVPGYSDGASPYGIWVWRTVAAMNGWTLFKDYNYDVAIVLLAPSTTEQHVQDLTGSLGMTVNAPKQAQTVAYGYSSNVEQGKRLASCSGLATPATIPQVPDYQGMGLPCSLSAGSAGGPWTQDGSYQTSVNSFTLATQSNVMFGLYFGDAVLNLWEQYQRQ